MMKEDWYDEGGLNDEKLSKISNLLVSDRPFLKRVSQSLGSCSLCMSVTVEALGDTTKASSRGLGVPGLSKSKFSLCECTESESALGDTTKASSRGLGVPSLNSHCLNAQSSQYIQLWQAPV